MSANEYVVYSLSDGCGYQSRNATLGSALSYFSQSFGKTVTQNILEKGHIQMKGERHNRKKFKKKTTHPLSCSLYFYHERESRQNPRQYDVKYLLTYDFFKTFLKSTV